MNAATAHEKRRWQALYVLCTGMLMIVLDATIVNVALPSIRDDLHFTSSNLSWVVNAYLIAFAGLLLLSGRLGDLLGQRKIFIIGLTIFTAASVLCAVSPTQEVLIAARFIQGVGGALASAVVLSMIVMMFPEPAEMAKAIGVYAFVASAGGSIGLLLGGFLTDAINWHWIFLINVPIGVITLVLTKKLVDELPGIGFGKGADIPGAFLITAGLMLAVYTILGIKEHGLGSTHTVLLATGSAALIVMFAARQATAANPLIPANLLSTKNVIPANLTMCASAIGMFGMFFLGALYLQEILEYSPLQVGVAFLPVTAVMGTLSLKFSGVLMMRFGMKRVLLVGLIANAIGLIYFTLSPVNGDFLSGNFFAYVLPVMLLFGIGAGLSMPAIMNLAMAEATPEDAGLASGLINTSAQGGGAFGLAILASIAASRTDNKLAAGLAQPEAFNAGYHSAYLVGAALMIIASVVTAVWMKEPAARPNDPSAGI